MGSWSFLGGEAAVERRGSVRKGWGVRKGPKACGCGACRHFPASYGPIGTAWPRTGELSWLLPPENLQKLTCKTEHCSLEWRPGDVTRDVLCLAGCLSVRPSICPSVCLFICLRLPPLCSHPCLWSMPSLLFLSMCEGQRKGRDFHGYARIAP